MASLADRATGSPVVAVQEAPPPRPWWLQLANIVMRLLLLVCAGAVMQVGWVAVWTLSYRLTHGNDFTYTYLITQPAVWDRLMDLLVVANTLVPGLELPGFQGPVSLDVVVNSLVMAFILTGIGYLAALTLVDLGISAVKGAVWLVVLVELVFQITLFLTPGLFTTDIFSYVMYGHISALYQLNPYIYPPNYFPGNPLLDWIHPIWHDQPSVYGPLWTAIGWIMAMVTAQLNNVVTTLDDGSVLRVGLMQQVFAYKLLMNGVQIVNLAIVWWLLGRVFANQPRARLTGFVLFAWNPLMLFDVAGNAHNDALMVTLLLLGIAPLVWRRGEPRNLDWTLGTLFLGLSALIKYTTAVVGVFLIVPWARRLATWRSRVLWIGGAGLLVGLVSFVLFIPWLDPRALDPILTAAGGKPWMYTNWAPDLIALTVDHFVDPSTIDDPTAWHETARFWTKTVARAIVAVYFAWEVVNVWRIAARRDGNLLDPILTASSRVFTVMILLWFSWVLEWYWMWPLALVMLLGWQRTLTRVVVGYTLTSLPVFYVHHYWSTNMPGVLILAYALPPLVLPLVDWAWKRWVSRASNREAPASSVLRPGLTPAPE